MVTFLKIHLRLKFQQGYDTDELIYKTETDLQTQRTDLWLPRGRRREEGWRGSLGLTDANYYT